MPVFQACVVKHMKNDSSGSTDFQVKKIFMSLFFSGKIVTGEFQWGILWTEFGLLAKTLMWITNAFFPDIDLVTFWEQNIVLVAVRGVGEGQHQRTAKKNTASKILIFRDPFSIYKTKTANKTQLYNRLGKKAVILPSDTWDSFGNRINQWHI